MQLSIFLHHIDQEFITKEKPSWDKWSRWWQSNMSIARYRGEEKAGIDEIKMRKEKFGSLIYNPQSSTVFKADKDFTEAFERYKKGRKLEKLAEDYNIAVTEFEQLVSKILNKN